MSKNAFLKYASQLDVSATFAKRVLSHIVFDMVTKNKVVRWMKVKFSRLNSLSPILENLTNGRKIPENLYLFTQIQGNVDISEKRA